MLTQETLKHHFGYDEETGVFTRIRTKARNIPNNSVGTVNQKFGYLYIRLEGKKHLAHRLAWLYVHGALPKLNIDHINGDKLDNRLCNLRESTQSQNMFNKHKRRTNKTGYRGVRYNDKAGTWSASCTVNKKIHWLGVFNCPIKAHAAYTEFAKANHGEFYSEVLTSKPKNEE